MNPPIKVAMIIQAYYPHVGGAERQLAALAPLLQRLNVDLTVFTRRRPGLAPFEVVGGAPVYRLPAPGPKAIASLTFTLLAVRRLAALRPHLIHAHELLSPTTAAVAAKKLLGVPVAAKALRGGALGDVAKLQNRLTGPRRMAAFSRRVDAFIAISREIEAELAAAGVPPDRRVFIPSGVDTARFAPASPEAAGALRSRLGLPDGPTLLFVGRLVPEKRVNQLIQIWPSVRAVHPRASLAILGTGEQEAWLKAQAGAGVQFMGNIQDVAPYLQAADAFALPSSAEGLSNALLEAMAAGLPVIASRVGGAPDLIDDGRSGRLVPPDDPASLAGAIIELLGNQARRRQMGALARQKVMQEYALPTVAQRLRTLYDRLLNSQPALASSPARRQA
ncbi:MAG: glycosyltransferase family 4 protein [Anaerolineae bacterium]